MTYLNIKTLKKATKMTSRPVVEKLYYHIHDEANNK